MSNANALGHMEVCEALCEVTLFQYGGHGRENEKSLTVLHSQSSYLFLELL